MSMCSIYIYQQSTIRGYIKQRITSVKGVLFYLKNSVVKWKRYGDNQVATVTLLSLHM